MFHLPFLVINLTISDTFVRFALATDHKHATGFHGNQAHNLLIAKNLPCP